MTLAQEHRQGATGALGKSDKVIGIDVEEWAMKLVKSMVFMMIATTALGVWITAIALGA